MKKKWIAGALACAMAITMTGCGNSDSGKPQLYVSSFNLAEDTTARDVFGPFEEAFDCSVVKELGLVSDRYTKLEANPDNSEIDVMELSQAKAAEGYADGLFQKIDTSRIENYDALIDIAKQLNIDSGGYGLPYTVNAMGIIYDEEVVGFEITEWADLWRPELKGKIAIPVISNTFGPAMVHVASDYAGVDIKSDNGEAAFAALAELKPNIVKTYSKSADVANMFSSGEIAVAVIGDYAYNTVIGACPDAKLVYPESGSYVSFNTIEITKNCKNLDLAYEWINYRLSAETQTRTQSLENDGLGEVPTNGNVQVTSGTNVETTFNVVKNNAKTVDYTFVLPLLDEWTTKWNQTLNG